jgi:hypothetical protein
MVDKRLNSELHRDSEETIKMTTLGWGLNKVLRVCVLAALSAAVIGFGNAEAVTQGTITMRSGTKTGLQHVFAWSARCKTVPVSYSGGASIGRLVTVHRSFRVNKGNCAGRVVGGYSVVYHAPANFKGAAQVNYRLKPANSNQAFNFSRTMIVR